MAQKHILVDGTSSTKSIHTVQIENCTGSPVIIDPSCGFAHLCVFLSSVSFLECFYLEFDEVSVIMHCIVVSYIAALLCNVEYIQTLCIPEVPGCFKEMSLGYVSKATTKESVIAIFDTDL